MDQIQHEKDEMISGLTSRLSDLEGEVGEVGSLSDGYKVVQEELQVGILLFPTLFDSAKEWVLGCVTLASSFSSGGKGDFIQPLFS